MYDILDNIDKPKVSVIIPVYNVKQYLAEALDSVINQTYKNLEIIVIDDGSNDGSEIVCEEYAQKDNRIKLIHQANGGLSAARNTGLDSMTGEYVMFLDSDDAFLPEAVEKSLNALLSKDVDCVVFKYDRCKTKKNEKLKSSINKIKPSLHQGIYTKEAGLKAVAELKINALVWNKISKREIWNNLRFPEGHVYEDLYIIFRMFEQIKKVYIMNETLVLYRVHDGSICTTKSLKNVQDLLDSWSIFENYIATHTPENFDASQIEKIHKIIFNNLVLHYIKVLSMYFKEKTEVLFTIKKYIKKYEKEINIKEYNREIRFAYYLMFNNSKFLLILFPPFFILYKFIKNIIKLIVIKK